MTPQQMMLLPIQIILVKKKLVKKIFNFLFFADHSGTETSIRGTNVVHDISTVDIIDTNFFIDNNNAE